YFNAGVAIPVGIRASPLVITYVVCAAARLVRKTWLPQYGQTIRPLPANLRSPPQFGHFWSPVSFWLSTLYKRPFSQLIAPLKSCLPTRSWIICSISSCGNCISATSSVTVTWPRVRTALRICFSFSTCTYSRCSWPPLRKRYAPMPKIGAMTPTASKSPSTAPPLVVSSVVNAVNTQAPKTSSSTALTIIRTKPTVFPPPIISASQSCIRHQRFYVSRQTPRSAEAAAATATTAAAEAATAAESAAAPPAAGAGTARPAGQRRAGTAEQRAQARAHAGQAGAHAARGAAQPAAEAAAAAGQTATLARAAARQKDRRLV